MNWKIKNISEHAVKLVVSTSSVHSVGIKLMPGESVYCLPRQTPSIDAQSRRRLLEIDKNFDNNIYGLTMGQAYTDTVLEEMKMKKAQEDATNYASKK